MKKFAVIMMAIAVAVTACVGLVACNGGKATEDYTYVSLKINPAVDFVVDSEGKVESFYCANEDAEVLLAGIDLEGMSVEEAAETVVDMSVEAGYIDADTEGKDVEVSAIGSDDSEDAETFGKVEKSINDYFVNKGIFGRVSKATLDTYLADAAELGISVGHVKLLMLACDRTGMTLDELKDKPMGEIMKLVNGKNKEARGKCNGNAAKQQERKALRDGKCAANAAKLQAHEQSVAGNAEVAEQIAEYQYGE